MNKDYKAKLLEKAGIYIDCCQLLKCVYKLLFSMPKKDRVIIGDIVTVHNTSESAITIDLGTRPGSGGDETKSMTLNALCAMQFICCLKLTAQGTTHVQWAPLGNAMVTWA